MGQPPAYPIFRRDWAGERFDAELVLALTVVVLGGLAVRLFRWE